MQRAVLVLCLAAAGACERATEPAVENVSMVAQVVDERNRPLRPDWVVWFYDHPLKYDGHHDPECLNSGCTRWGVPPGVTGVVHISAQFSRVAGRCSLDSDSATASAADPPAVTLRLDTRQESCL